MDRRAATSGFLLLVPRAEAIDLPISVEDGVRMVISGGILLPRVRQVPAPVEVEVEMDEEPEPAKKVG